MQFELRFPADFADYEWEVELKGWFSLATLVVDGNRFQLNFFDPTRLSQEIEDDCNRGSAFFEPNLIVVPSVTREEMEKAVRQLFEGSRIRIRMLVQEQE